MCGICGVVNLGPSAPPITGELVRGMTAPMAHRGPDAEDVYLAPDGHVGLGLRRLSIVDLAPPAISR